MERGESAMSNIRALEGLSFSLKTTPPSIPANVVFMWRYMPEASRAAPFSQTASASSALDSSLGLNTAMYH
ncbi:MAG: hypothetical protein OWQ51_11485 [Pyrobaculum arsenaticum]|nr:hypothetical protein [Pyrobaculum arsenaticum]